MGQVFREGQFIKSHTGKMHDIADVEVVDPVFKVFDSKQVTDI